MSIQQQVDDLIDTRPGRELLVPTYDATFSLFEEGEVVSGIVVRIQDGQFPGTR